MELLVLAVFTGMLIGCVAFGIPVLYALVGGLLLFFTYSLKKRIFPEGNDRYVSAGDQNSKKCSAYHDIDRRTYRFVEVRRHDPDHRSILCAADHTVHFYPSCLFIKLPGVLFL